MRLSWWGFLSVRLGHLRASALELLVLIILVRHGL